jgi:hypothetical protein
MALSTYIMQRWKLLDDFMLLCVNLLHYTKLKSKHRKMIFEIYLYRSKDYGVA